MSWEKVKLGDVFSVMRNGASIKQEPGKSGIPITRIETIANGIVDTLKLGYADITNDDYEEYYLKTGDILMSHINSWAHLGKTAIVNGINEKIIHGMNLLLLRSKQTLLPTYAKYFFETTVFKTQLFRISNQSVNQSSFPISKLKGLQIPLPPLPIQQKIAAILDQADALRKKDRQLLSKYDELLQAVFYDMFGDPLKNEKGWEKDIVINYCDCIVPGRDKPKSFSGNIPWVTTDDLEHLGVTTFSKRSIGLTRSEIDEVRARIIPKNSVIMTCVGDLGIISIAGTEMVVNQQLHAFQTKEKLNNFFLMYMLSKRKDYMLRMATSTTVPYMNKTICNSIPILVPPLSLQTHFAHVYKNIIGQKNKLKHQIKQSENLFQCLLQQAFKGELVKE